MSNMASVARPIQHCIHDAVFFLFCVDVYSDVYLAHRHLSESDPYFHGAIKVLDMIPYPVIFPYYIAMAISNMMVPFSWHARMFQKWAYDVLGPFMVWFVRCWWVVYFAYYAGYRFWHKYLKW
jgi:hypothetical protein